MNTLDKIILDCEIQDRQPTRKEILKAMRFIKKEIAFREANPLPIISHGKYELEAHN